MTDDSSSAESGRPAGSSHFATTRWSLVAAAAGRGTDEARAALETLCQSYWYPLYAFIRRQGNDAPTAQDLTQGFFLELLSKDRLQHASSQRGRFRAFLLASARHYLANARRDARAQKRGGGQVLLSLDFTVGEQRYLSEPVDRLTPERIFDRRWALTVTSEALAALEAQYSADGRGELFANLAPYLNGAGDSSYAELGGRLGMSETAVKTAIHRLRTRCRDLIRAEIARTVDSDAEVEDELRELFQALGE